MGKITIKELKDRYTGKTAEMYETKRKSKRWDKEDKYVFECLNKFKDEINTVIDAPVGTGRFFPHYKQLGLKVVGIDVSEDMIAEAYKKAEKLLYNDISIIKESLLENISNIDADMLVCIRFLNWVSFADFQKIINNFSMSNCKYFVLQVSDDRHKSKKLYRHPLESIKKCFEDNRLELLESKHIQKSNYIYLLKNKRE